MPMLGAGANSTGLARGPARRDAVEDCSPYRGTCGCYNLRVFCSQDDLESEGGSPQVERSQSSRRSPHSIVIPISLELCELDSLDVLRAASLCHHAVDQA